MIVTAATGIGALIRERRLARGLTQAELARAVGSSRPAVVLWESETRNVPLRKLRRVATALNVPISSLLGDTGEARDVQLLVDTYKRLPEDRQKKFLEILTWGLEGDVPKTRSHPRQAGRIGSVGLAEQVG